MRWCCFYENTPFSISNCRAEVLFWSERSVQAWQNEIFLFLISSLSRSECLVFFSRYSRRSFALCIVLFLVEKSPVNINCLIACLIDCVSAPHWSIEELGKDRKGIFSIRVDRRVIRVEELESGVSLLNFFFGSIFLHKGLLFYKEIFL